jgi:anti-anti-sigma regulatory factor
MSFTPGRSQIDVRIVVLEVEELVEPDAGVIDLIARLQLVARRAGCELRLSGASPELRELIGLSGLDPALLRVEARGQPEQGEEPSGVEEEGELRDPPP